MFEDRWCLLEPFLLPQRWVLFEYSCFDQFPKYTFILLNLLTKVVVST